MSDIDDNNFGCWLFFLKCLGLGIVQQSFVCGWFKVVVVEKKCKCVVLVGKDVVVLQGKLVVGKGKFDILFVVKVC